MTELEMLEELRNFDTPSITNVVATYPEHPLCLGPVSYTHLTLPTILRV